MRCHICALPLLLAGCASAPPVSKASLEASELVRIVTKAAQDAEASLDAAGVELSCIFLTIGGSNAVSHSGGIDAVVLKAGTGREVTTSHSLTIKLERSRMAPLKADSVPLSRTLEATLTQVAQLAGAKGSGSFVTGPMAADIGFDLVESSEAGISLEFGEVGFSYGGERRVTGTHSIQMAFKKKEETETPALCGLL